MTKFKVRYIHQVEITYDAIINAETPEQAIEKLKNGDFISEEEVEYQGMYIHPQYAELLEEE